MNARQLALVRETFDRLRPVPKAFGATFYERLFEIEPSLRALFKGSLENQAAMFATALAMSVAGLGEDGYVPASVRELAGRHVEYGIPDSAFGPFRDALLATLALHLGDAFTPEAREAWTAAFTTLASAMKQAAGEARAAREAEERSLGH
jgi:hemoglobin-like flavoprotein